MAGTRIAVGGIMWQSGGPAVALGPDQESLAATRILGNIAVEFVPAGVPPPGIPPVLMVIRQR